MDDDKTIPFPDKQTASQGQLPDQGPPEQGKLPGHDNGWRPPVSHAEPEPRPEPQTPATERLAAAQARLLGEDVPLHNGQPEKGSGSRHAALHPAHLAHLHALEHLVTVETEHATAERAMQDADAKLAHALKRADDTEVVSSEVESSKSEG